jgi:hypothetical protein
MSRLKWILLILIAQLALSAVASTTALALETVEAPFWSVGGKRLEAEETRQLTSETVATNEATLAVPINGIASEIRCRKGNFNKLKLRGSHTRHDGKAGAFLEFIECTLFKSEGKVEQKGCEVVPFATVELLGRLWLEGTKTSGSDRMVIVFEPEALKGGKPVIAEITIKKKGSEACEFTTTNYTIEGSFGANITPEKEEAEALTFILPSTPIKRVWQPPEQEAEMTIGLGHEGTPIVLEHHLGAKPVSKEEFGTGGGIPVPIWVHCVKGTSGAKWTTNKCTTPGTGEWETKQLGAAEIDEITSSTVPGSKGLELEDSKAPGGATAITCTGTSTGTVSANGTGSVKTSKVTGCKFVAGKVGSCEESKGVTITYRNLGWSTVLEERGVGTGKEVRDVITSLVAGKSPGYSVECTVAGIFIVTDTCEGVISTNVRAIRAEGTVEAVFDKTSEEETGTCTVGGAKAGRISGTTISKLRNGGAYWILAKALNT